MIMPYKPKESLTELELIVHLVQNVPWSDPYASLDLIGGKYGKYTMNLVIKFATLKGLHFEPKELS